MTYTPRGMYCRGISQSNPRLTVDAIDADDNPHPLRSPIMCSPATCKTCGKTTWAGCGMHVDQVMAGVPKADRCPGHEADAPAVKVGFSAKMFSR